MNRNLVRSAVAVCAGIGLVGAVVVAGGLTRGYAPNGSGSGKADRRVPVLVELFTSEGCSSCPSADQELEQLQKSQPIANAIVIPMSEHVDYWNYIGWADPFSAASFSERQRGYARALRLDSVYTPQMVVNGQTEFVGSDRGRAEAAIARAALAAHADVQVKLSNAPGAEERLDIRIDSVPQVRRGDTADVMLAITENGLQSSVARGENAGRKLGHTAVVRSLRSLGSTTAGQPFSATPALTLDPKWKRRDLGAVVFVQERASRRVLGAARVSLDPGSRD